MTLAWRPNMERIPNPQIGPFGLNGPNRPNQIYRRRRNRVECYDRRRPPPVSTILPSL